MQRQLYRSSIKEKLGVGC